MQRVAAPTARCGALVQRAGQRVAAARAPACRRRSVAVRAAAEMPEGDPEVSDARGAIAIGLKYSAAGNWAQAQEYWERALELPGTGLKRYRDKPPALSEGELTAALFNIACARAQLGDLENGMVALAGCVEQGYRNFAQLRSDPDLAPLRADPRFEGLLARFERAQAPKGGFLGLF